MSDNTTIGLLTNINNSLGKIVELMLPQNQDAKKGQEQSVKNLSQGSLGSGANTASTASAAESISGLNVAQIVSSLDSLPEQVKMIAKLSGRTIRNFKHVLNSIVDTFTQDSFKSLDKKSELGVNLVKILTDLGPLPDIIKGIGKVKEEDVESFTKAVGMLLDMITKPLRESNVSDKDIELAKKTVDTILTVTSAVKSMAKITLVAPLAMAGLLTMIPVWLTFSAVLMLIGSMEKPIQKGLNALRGVDEFMTNMFKTALLGIAVAGGVILLGFVIKTNMDLMRFGLAGMITVFTAVGIIAVLGGLIGLLIKSTNIFDKQIINFTLELMLIAGLTAALGMLLQVGWEQMMIGLKGMTVVMFAMIGIALLIKLTGEISTTSIKAMGGVLLLMMTSMAVAALSVLLGKHLEENIGHALIGFAAMTAILGEVIVIALLAEKVAITAKAGVMNLLIAEGVILGAMAIIQATIKTGELVWNYFGTDTVTAVAKVMVVSAVAAAAIMGASKVTNIANRASKDIKNGAIALILAEGVIVASAVVALAVIGVSKVMESVEPSTLINTLLTMTTIVGAAGAVALIASKFQNSAIKGALAMVAIEALILGMVGVTHALVMTAKAAAEIGWTNVFIAVGSMTALLGLFTGLTAAFTLLCNPYTLTVLGAGGAVMLSISALILAVTGTTMAVIKLAEMMDKSGKTTQELGETLYNITHDVFSYKNLDPEISVAQAANLSAKYRQLMPALSGITAVVSTVSDMAKRFGGLSEMRGSDYYISPYYGMNGNEPVFGEPVNIPKIAENIVQAITIFSDKLFEGFENVDLSRLVAVGITMRSLIEPVTQFTKMVSGFKDGEGPESLKPVFVSEDGSIRYGESVNVINVATSIAGAIAAFATTLYGNGEDIPKWMEFMGKRRNKKRLERAMNTFALVIEPVEKFMDLMLSYQSAGPGMLKKASFDEQGNFVDNGAPAINIGHVASGIASAISAFAITLFGDGNTLPDWMKVFKRENNADAITKAMGALGNVIAPIESFVNALTMIEPSGDDMYHVWVDDKGNVQRKKVYLKSTALAIAGTVSVFVETLFGPTTANAWKAMLNTTKGGQQIVFGADNQDSPFGVFGEIIDPIANFARVITDIGGETRDGNMVLPIYDKDGRRIGERVVDLRNTAGIIANAVTLFVSTLFSGTNKDLWLSLIYNTASDGTVIKNGATNTNLKDSIGVFAQVIDPVVKFAQVISMFGGTADNFQVYDGEKVRTINLIDVATAVATAVTTFMTTLRPAFNDLEFGIEEKSKITDFSNTVGDILENFAKIGETKVEQINVANTIIDSYVLTVKKISEVLKGLPEIKRIIDMEAMMQKCIALFSIFKDVKFEELNYKEGFDHFTYVFNQCAAISEISARVDQTAFDVIDKFVTAARTLNDFYNDFKAVSMPVLTQFITSISEISIMYAGLPLIPDTEENRNKLWFIEPFVAVANVIKSVLQVDASFASNTKAMLDFITGMGNSMLALGATPSTDLNEVTKAYEALLDRVIKLSTRQNVKSINAMNDAIKEATTRITKFDDRLIRHANDRKKKLDELVETVGSLNEKLEKTAKSMEDIAKDLEKISKFDEDTIKRNINAANRGSSPAASKSGGFGETSAPAAPAVSGGNISGPSIGVDEIKQAIEQALQNLHLKENSFTITIAKEMFEDNPATDPVITISDRNSGFEPGRIS